MDFVKKPQVYNRIGGANQYQFRLLAFFSFQMLILSSIILSSPSFLFATPKFLCDGNFFLSIWKRKNA